MSPELDVERLTRAIKARRDLAPYRPSQESFLMVDWLEYADAIAAEYAHHPEGEPPLDELLDLIEELSRYLRPYSSEEQPGEVEASRRARALLARYRPPPSKNPGL